ncbi:conserved hypothetical protein [Flavobacterium sp. 9AF]|uniref:hypothetical protein n=1 Tax=Flavobacterium sp. 9AF TaxID=2653142 RepID=UPI0012F1885A|nr:hypothetical protein [Flavobacterium sp. 9AF]VXB53198.1 conserved hypothetical protein [Flavobacterium sp. 9AF]
MGKSFLLFIYLSSHLNLLSQESSENKQQRWYKETIAEMNDSNRAKSMVKLFNVYNKDRQSELGKIALKKSDSLKILVRKEILDNIQGEWKLKKSGSNWGFTEIDEKKAIEKIVVIKENEILFFDQEKVSGIRKLIKKEIIRYYDNEELFPSFIGFVFSDRLIWSFQSRDSNLLHTMHLGEETQNGRTYISCGNSELIYERVN